jgi:hypothetical protein
MRLIVTAAVSALMLSGAMASEICKECGRVSDDMFVCRTTDKQSVMPLQRPPVCLTAAKWAEMAARQQKARTGPRWGDANSAATPTTGTFPR